MFPAPAAFAIPILASAAFAATLGWFGYRHLRPDPAPRPAPTAAGTPAPAGPAGPAPAPPPVREAGLPADPREAGRDGGRPSAPPASPAPPSSAGAPAAPGPQAGPAFDVVRVEPGGDSVIAGRAAPGATVRLIVNGRVHAETPTDAAGNFVLVPPALPPGTSEIVLEAAAGDGRLVPSAQSVTVVIAPGGTEPPLVTVAAPGQPTVILSRPDAPARVAGLPGAGSVTGASPPAAVAPSLSSSPSSSSKSSSSPASSSATGGQASPPPAAAPVPGAADRASSPGPGRVAAASPPDPASPGGKRPAIQIVSVEAEGSGRLYVSANAAPGATVRLYLNDTFVAPAVADGDGRLAFAIERGVRPGAYRVRLDEVDPASEAVRSRAEVPFSMPAQIAAGPEPARPAPPSVEASGPASEPGPAPSRPEPARTEAAAPGPERPPLPSSATPLPPRTASAGEPRSAAAAPTSQAAPLAAAPAAAPVGQPSLSGNAPAVPVPAGRDTAGPAPVVVAELKTAIVTRGESLWAISRRVYGEGLRYTVIYGANSPQIRDPNLIYPGQVFVLPGSKRAGATP